MDYRDRRLVLGGIGLLVLLAGAASALLGPAEMYVFYLFSEGGRFYYEGFGFGSFMFGNIATQIVGYYFIAALLIPLGYGHIALRRWARTLALTLLGAWLVVGIPLAILIFLVLVASKDFTVAFALTAAVVLGLSYFAVPWVMGRFYHSRDVRRTFEAHDPNSYAVEKRPLPILVLSVLYLLYLALLHVPIFFRGLFPLFGTLLSDIQGIMALDASIACLAVLLWGTWRQHRWAWGGSLAYFGLMLLSMALTFGRASLADILTRAQFPPTEMEILQNVPLQGWHLALFIGAPLLATLGLVLFSRRFFSGANRPPVAEAETDV